MYLLIIVLMFSFCDFCQMVIDDKYIEKVSIAIKIIKVGDPIWETKKFSFICGS